MKWIRMDKWVSSILHLKRFEKAQKDYKSSEKLNKSSNRIKIILIVTSSTQKKKNQRCEMLSNNLIYCHKIQNLFLANFCVSFFILKTYIFFARNFCVRKSTGGNFIFIPKNSEKYTRNLFKFLCLNIFSHLKWCF